MTDVAAIRAALEELQDVLSADRYKYAHMRPHVSLVPVVYTNDRSLKEALEAGFGIGNAFITEGLKCCNAHENYEPDAKSRISLNLIASILRTAGLLPHSDAEVK